MAVRRCDYRPAWLLCWLLCAQLARVHSQATLAIATASAVPTVVYEWDVSKSSTDSSLSIQQGSTGSTSFTVAFTQSSAPPVVTVQGQAVLSNPAGAGQLQVAEVEVQVQFSQAPGSGPVTASVSCPAADTVGGVLLVNAGAQLACNYTAPLPSISSSAGPFVIAQANLYSAGAPIVSAPRSLSAAGAAAAQLPAAIGQCALVTDTFDPLTYQALGPPTILQGRKPPRASEAPAKICASTNFTYTIQWSVGAASACGDYVVASTAAVNPVGGQQPTASTTNYLEINACNSAEMAVPPPVEAAADADSSAPQVDVSITSMSGGGPSFSWGVSATVDTPSVQVANASTAQVTFSIAFTRSPPSASAGSGARTISGAVTVTNPAAEPTVLTEVEVSWVSSDNTQQQDAPASCPGSVGGSVTLGANQVVACLFTINYASIQSGSLWASVVTSTAQAAQATQVTVPPVDPSSSTAVGACGMASGGFETGGVGQLVPVSFTADSTVPPSSAAPVQLCDSASFTFTGVFGPFTTCGQQMATATAQLNPTGGQQATQTADITADFTVLC